MTVTQVGRNDLCPCGSGKKFKKCCLPQQRAQEFIPATCSPPAAQPNAPPLPDSQWPDWLFVKGKGWTHKKDVQVGDQVQVQGGHWETVEAAPERLVRTTQEHPFYVQGKGWTPAGELKEGDVIRTDNGWVPISKIVDTGDYETVYNVRVSDYHTYFVGEEDWGFAVWAHNAYNVGDVLSRTVGGATESVALPPINMTHLETITVQGGRVSGFHILPTSVVTISSTSEITLAAGSIQVLDSAGNPIAGAQIKITPLRVPASTSDAFEAKVEVLDSSGTRIAYDPSKAFFPQGWTTGQIQQAIYSPTRGITKLAVPRFSCECA